MTRDQIQSKISEIMGADPIPTLLTDLQTQIYQWLLDENVDDFSAKRIIDDLKSYQGTESLS